MAKGRDTGNTFKSSNKYPSESARIIANDQDYGKLIIKLLRRIMQSFDTHSRCLLKEYDLTIPQVMCLYEVYEKGATTVAVLAENIHLTPSTLIGILDRLEEKRFIKRMRDGIDRRSVFINITAKGHKFVTETPYLMHNRLHAEINNLARNKQLLIADALNSILHMLENG